MSGAAQTFENRIEIRAPAKHVFEVMVDLAWLKESVPQLGSIELRPPGAMRRGSRLVVSIRDDDRVQSPQIEVEVTDFVASRVVEYSAFMAFRRKKDRTVTRLEVEAYGPVSRLVVKTSVTVETLWLRLSWPLTKRLLSWATNRQLKKLKAKLEGA